MKDKLKSQLGKRGWDVKLYKPIYDKCKKPQKLRGDDYRKGIDLAEIGLMQTTYKPVWSGDNYKGNEVEFLSV